MGNYGLIVTLPGNAYETATPEQCALHSSWAHPKIGPNTHTPVLDSTYGTASVTNTGFNFNLLTYSFTTGGPAAPGGTGSSTFTLLTVNHGYSYTPAALVYFQDVNNFFLGTGAYSQMPASAGASPRSDQQFTYYTDNTNLYIQYTITSFYVSGSQFNIFNPHNLNGYQFKFKYYIFAENGA